MDHEHETTAPENRQTVTAHGSHLCRDDSAAMRVLVKVVEEMSTSRELDDLLRKVADRTKSLVDYDALGVLLLDPLGQELRMHFGRGFSSEVVEHWRFGLGQGIVGTAAKSGQPVLASEVSKNSHYITGLPETRSELAVPLIAKNRTIGVLDVQSRKAGHFNESHQRVLSALAGHLANAIENARLYSNLLEQARTLSLLHELGRELSSILDRDELLQKVATLVKRLVDFQLFTVMLWNEKTQLLENAFFLKFDERFCQKTGFPLGYGISGTVAALRQALRVPNVNLDPRYVNCGHNVEVRSELCVPLLFKDRLIGVLDLESVEYNAFSEHHEQILSTLASHIAIALENARLYEKVRENEKRLEDDLATAREIQKGLLPEVAPRVPGLEVGAAYAPARELGGDFYDFLPYPDDRLAIAVGDVAGKAAAAALQGSLAVGILRGHVVEHACEPAAMLEHLNPHLFERGIDNRFVAMAFALYDIRGRKLTIANAGFTRPRLMRDGRVEEIPVQGIPLGLLAGPDYEQKELSLRTGDLILFCSDGIHECMNRDGEEFGNARMEKLLAELEGSSAQEIADGLLRATDRFAAPEGEHADDRTVVVLKVS